MIGRTVYHVRKKDLIQVMTGREKGKTGKILRINQKSGKVFVEKLNIFKRHTKPTGKAAGGIIEHEGPIALANVLLYCDKCSKGVRTKFMPLESGKKVRVCRKCSTQLDK